MSVFMQLGIWIYALAFVSITLMEIPAKAGRRPIYYYYAIESHPCQGAVEKIVKADPGLLPGSHLGQMVRVFLEGKWIQGELIHVDLDLMRAGVRLEDKKTRVDISLYTHAHFLDIRDIQKFSDPLPDPRPFSRLLGKKVDFQTEKELRIAGHVVAIDLRQGQALVVNSVTAGETAALKLKTAPSEFDEFANYVGAFFFPLNHSSLK